MLTFFLFVVPSSTTYKVFGNRITFNLKKIFRSEWPRLQETAEKVRFTARFFARAINFRAFFSCLIYDLITIR